jgi:hypothetical protein
MTMKASRIATTMLLLVLLTAVDLPALSWGGGASVQLPPPVNASVYGGGYGIHATASFSPVVALPLEVQPELAAFFFPPRSAGIQPAWILLPSILVGTSIDISVPNVFVAEASLLVGYRHYLWWTSFDDQLLLSYRPVATGGVLVPVHEIIRIGPRVFYNVYFDETVRGAVQIDFSILFSPASSPP